MKMTHYIENIPEERLSDANKSKEHLWTPVDISEMLKDIHVYFLPGVKGNHFRKVFYISISICLYIYIYIDIYIERKVLCVYVCIYI